MRFDHKGRPEVEGTMSQSPDGMYLVDIVDDVARLQVGVKEGGFVSTAEGAGVITCPSYSPFSTGLKILGGHLQAELSIFLSFR